MGLLLTIALIITVFSIKASKITLRILSNDYLTQKKIYNLTSFVNVSISKLPPGRSGHVITQVKDQAPMHNAQILVDISELNKIVHVKNLSQTIIVESGCSMETLLDLSLANGLIPKVLPEFRDITVGGAIVGLKLCHYILTWFLMLFFHRRWS